MAAGAVAFAIHGKPIVHPDLAMPQMVLYDTVAELGVKLVIKCKQAGADPLPADCRTLVVTTLLATVDAARRVPLRAARVAPD